MFVMSTIAYELSKYMWLFSCFDLSLFLCYLVITLFADLRMLHFIAHTNFYISPRPYFFQIQLLPHAFSEREENISCKQCEYILIEKQQPCDT